LDLKWALLAGTMIKVVAGIANIEYDNDNDNDNDRDAGGSLKDLFSLLVNGPLECNREANSVRCGEPR
jgi:hypothetical protein